MDKETKDLIDKLVDEKVAAALKDIKNQLGKVERRQDGMAKDIDVLKQGGNI